MKTPQHGPAMVGINDFGGHTDILATLAGPRELVRGERESFIGGYRRQHSGQAVGSPAMNAAD
ncbi:hypothetical protein, partial [Mycobacterium marinum]|uniref:hypothetical protein n=1 Tax=Mycobacterium marinum TaxID=1781 RepID=UPI0021C370DA